MITRRDLLKVAGVGAVALLAAPGAVRTSFGAEKKSIEDALKEHLGKGLSGLKESNLINIKAPTIAESGANVPVQVSANIPVDQVEALYIFADENFNPWVATVELTPMNGEVFFATRIKLAKTSPVRAVVKMKDGTLLAAAKEVKVTVGGCG
ncbi:thiosulfate-binding protein SoxY [Hydrogenivirga caldilitoris]|uniref:Thiosulfate-binding protein SoxY n=1 Tax=Hydrogenivirga caldilitoris TaxID=246264 RepID=A0A497XWA8_9AQUI|nr:thiosulfate oxidation carrier protein SoxY [Hydrogenivirga caldilitoris]RLJ71442.1 thiosulfate-binding protein SoxY [Hydrogenivirga caldilitoris]